MTSEKPVLHYITHTEDGRKQSRFEGVRTEHVQTDEIPANYPEISLILARPECARNARESPPIFHIPACPLLRSGAHQPRKVAPG